MAVVTIIRIGHRLAFPPLDMVEEQGELGLGAWGPHPPEVGEIVSVERDDVIEAAEIVRPDLPSPEVGDVDPLPGRDGGGATIGRVADMPVAGPRGVDLDVKPKPLRFRS